MEKKTNRRLQYGATATLFTAIVLAICIVVNVIAYNAVEKFNWKADITNNSLYEITDTTKDVVGSMGHDVELIALSSESNYDSQDLFKMVKEMLNRYSALSDRITVRYVDLNADPTFAASYTEKGTPLQEYGLIVKSDMREKIYTIMDLFEIDNSSGTAQVTGFKMEQAVTSALMYVNNEDTPQAAFTQGHNEYTGNTFPTLFEQNNYTTQQLTLTVQDIPDEVELLAICAPNKDFDPSEITKLDAFMARGGSLMIFMYPSASEMPNLSAFLEEWGLQMGNYVVFEPEAQTGSPLDIVPVYVPHLINNYFADNQYFMVMPQSRNINLLERNGKSVSQVLSSTSKAYGKEGLEFPTVQKQEGDTDGPFTLAATSEASVNVNGETKSAKIFLCGSRNMYYDDKLSLSNLANSEFLAQVMSWCGNGMETVSIPVKSAAPESINITQFMAVILAVVFTLIIPIAILAFGISVFLKRRHL